jgi:hypothetical protein
LTRRWRWLPTCWLGRARKPLRGLDADDRRDARGLELAPGVAEELLHGGGVEPARDLVAAIDGEVLTLGCNDTAGFELVLEGLHLGFVRLERQVGAADRICKSFVREIVKSAMGIRSLAMDSPSF